jgi:hypothetical protein
VTQLVLPLHEATAEPLHAATEVATDPAIGGAALNETSYSCVRV